LQLVPCLIIYIFALGKQKFDANLFSRQLLQCSSEDHNNDFDDDLLPGKCESTWRYIFLRLSAFLHEVPKKI